ncbi:transposase [Sedimentibacter sp.]|uniref:IS66 family transposase n=1 Tax=Sedimentibacter sp. TaxID=1960295 RepID=UPI0028A9C98D|nr:transposase [Sedimentibacter sp.]
MIISNNNAEHLAKSFVVSRKNFLFSNTPKGADSSELSMSIVETAKINKIDPFEYIHI